MQFPFIKENGNVITNTIIKEKDLLELLIKEANKGEMYYRHSACIFNGNELISIAHNYIPNTKLNNLYSIHAEIAAILKMPKKIKSKKNLKLYVIRLSNEDNSKLLFSKPCNNCLNTIKKKLPGIPVIYYSYSELNN